MPTKRDKTLGKVIQESELRAFAKCSQFHFYGGLVEPELETNILRAIIERLLADTLRYPERDVETLFSRAISPLMARLGKDLGLIPDDVEHYTRRVTLQAAEFFETFKPTLYTTVYGAMPLFVKSHDTLVSVRISGVLRSSQTKSLHLIDFAPYETDHANLNDPVIPLKIHAMKQFLRDSLGKPITKAVLHRFYINGGKSLAYTSVDSKESNSDHLIYTEAMLDLLRKGYHYPLTPCPHQCQFKRKCFLGEK